MEPEPIENPQSRRRWDGLAAVLAALIGFLALLVSGYTAYVQRQQVRAQVWPLLIVGYADRDRSMIALNKGVGPADVRAVQVFVDDQPKRNWDEVLQTLELDAGNYQRSTINNNVISAGERVDLIQMPDDALYERFRLAVQQRVKISICYCSTLDECWVRDRKSRNQDITKIDSCPAWPVDQQFKD